ncbi:hypothetical protein HPT29_002255 [Microvirga terrae]|uniref:cGAS/DncV-like nucleotidyltransferase C-terminal helical domain-containing protein n=1 Tax=Microvirga terrae TaxID=2740529 RepID=A0ABY5RRW4_9HYPH|nr:hypothetical protein [Microvirga terrae]UVF19996.1 hypothetical protein HPT29_002255 [Microvirga terrae]
MAGGHNYLLEALGEARTRSSWNDRLAHWERPASDHEETKIQRAANMARDIIARNAWLQSEGVTAEPQGSYFNNTNVRLDSDMDLRAQHPAIKTEYAVGIAPVEADRALGYYDIGRNLSDIVGDVRRQLGGDLIMRFGAENVEIGNKAITVSGLSGSRADVDVVPAFKLHWVRRSVGDLFGDYYHIEGVAILSTDGRWTYNFPAQHHANGKAKRERTRHRFKKVVRQLKRLNYEIAELRLIPQKLPSFLIECLVYAIEDQHFLYQEDHYDRLRRILLRTSELVIDDAWAASATEINEIKLLFANGQPWTIQQVRGFILAAIQRLRTN